MRQFIRGYYKYFLKNIDFAYLAYDQRYYGKVRDKWNIYKTCKKLHDLSKGKNKNQQATIQFFNFTVTGINAQSLLFLFKEVFLTQEYYFVADKECPVIVDCGANIGMSVLFFKMLYPKSIIYAFEPNPLAFELLQKNIAQNKLNNVYVENVCLAGEEGKVQFYFSKEDISSLVSSIRKERGGDKSYEVNAKKLSQIVKNKSIDMVKMDVEGAEFDIIQEMLDNKTLSYPDKYIIEFHHNLMNSKYNFSSFLRKLEVAGYDYNLKGKFEISEKFQDILVYFYKSKGDNKNLI